MKLKSIISIVLATALNSCTTVNVSCNQENYFSLPLMANNQVMVAVLNLRQETISDSQCETVLDSQLYVTVDNALNDTISFNYNIKFFEGFNIAAEFSQNIQHLKPGHSTDEELVSRNLIDIENSTILFTGSNLIVE